MVSDRMTQKDSLVQLFSVSKSFDDRRILHDIDLNINQESITTIIGPNGAGKTSLLRIVLGLDEPNHGRIQRRPGLRLGYVPQKFHKDPMLPLTVSRFLALSPQKPTRQTVQTTLTEIGALHLLDHRINVLSGGELQRILLARALLNNPDLLALDEPMQGVDLRGQAELYHLLLRIKKQKRCSILMVSHDLHFVMAATDKVVCLNGHICCSGKPENVKQHPEYQRLFGAISFESIGVYSHHHDHRHGLDGKITASHPQPSCSNNHGQNVTITHATPCNSTHKPSDDTIHNQNHSHNHVQSSNEENT